MTKDELILLCNEQYNIVEYIDINEHTDNFFKMEMTFRNRLKLLKQYYSNFDENDRLVFSFDSNICNTGTALEVVKLLQTITNEVDIPTFFVILLLNRTKYNKEIKEILDTHNQDVPMLIEYYTSTELPIEKDILEFANIKEKEEYY